MDINEAVKHHINNNTNFVIQYNNGKIYKITIISHSIDKFNKSENKQIN